MKRGWGDWGSIPSSLSVSPQTPFLPDLEKKLDCHQSTGKKSLSTLIPRLHKEEIMRTNICSHIIKRAGYLEKLASKARFFTSYANRNASIRHLCRVKNPGAQVRRSPSSMLSIKTRPTWRPAG